MFYLLDPVVKDPESSECLNIVNASPSEQCNVYIREACQFTFQMQHIEIEQTVQFLKNQWDGELKCRIENNW